MTFTLDDEEMTAFDMAKALKESNIDAALKILDKYHPAALQRLHQCIHDVLEHKDVWLVKIKYGKK